VNTVPLVFVSVGTDHHPFDRLVGWVDAWLPDGVRCVVQHGRSAPPRRAEGAAYLDHGELVALLEKAVAVVCHGGPTTITESRRHGRRPIVVPRSAELGEHVDDHQERFCARMAAKGLITTATGEDEFRALLDRALKAPEEFVVDARGNDVAESVERFGRLVDDLLLTRPRRRSAHGR
jgi:UDP-N-acetylglucosamine transferase subunit ALG13